MAVNLAPTNCFTTAAVRGRNIPENLPTQGAAGMIILQVSPNPGSGSFNLKLSANDNIASNIRILDISGRVLKILTVKPNEMISFGNDLPPGTYFMELTQGRTRRIERLVKL